MSIVRVLAVASIVVLTACNQDSSGKPGPAINQNSICQVDHWDRSVVAKACKVGQKVVFLPGNFGNEQIPIIFAAANCDLRYSVALTKGAVTCIYSPLSQSEEPAPGSKQ
jgi:hypothetical protein